MVSICDHQWRGARYFAANDEDGGKRLAFADPLEVIGDMRIIAWQQRQLRGAEQVLGSVVNRLHGSEIANQHLRLCFRHQQ